MQITRGNDARLELALRVRNRQHFQNGLIN